MFNLYHFLVAVQRHQFRVNPLFEQRVTKKIMRRVHKLPDTKGHLDGLTERLDGQLQLPFQNIAESFPY